MKDFTGQSIMANYFRGIEAVGGKIHFYEDKLIFKSHVFNIQRGETEIKYSDIAEIQKRVNVDDEDKKERVLVTTLTKKQAEDLTQYLKNIGIKVEYLHSDIKALERLKIIKELRMGKFDVLIGINLLREGLDIPEVSLVAILNADKEGFLRSERSLIQTIRKSSKK